MTAIDGRTARTAQVRKPKSDGFTAAKRKAFLQHLALSCNVRQSARAAGVYPGNVYKLRLRDAGFAELWAAAMETGYVRLEAALLERALGGTATPDAVELAEVLGVTDTPADTVDVELALKLLARRRDEIGRPRPHRARLTPHNAQDVYAALVRKVTAIEKRLEQRR